MLFEHLRLLHFLFLFGTERTLAYLTDLKFVLAVYFNGPKSVRVCFALLSNSLTAFW